MKTIFPKRTPNAPSPYLSGIMGVVTGDALGCPVQFMSREELSESPVTTMEGFGTFNLPAGSWTDDSSLTLALLASLKSLNRIDLDDIASRFTDWLFKGEYTPYGQSFDIGRTCQLAIQNYKRNHDVTTCGLSTESDNGNGSLMRIMPACIYVHEQVQAGKLAEAEGIEQIHAVSALTHAHLRSQMACGLYCFMVKHILSDKDKKPLIECLQEGITEGRRFYEADSEHLTELQYFTRLFDLSVFQRTPLDVIMSTGYVVDTIEASVWCLITTDTLKEALLKAANLGLDTDTVAAIAGGLAGLYYGYEAIPEEWLKEIKRRKWIEELCLK